MDETADTVKYLLVSGADVSLVTSRQDTALHWACKFSNEYVVRLLLEYKSNVNAINSLQYTPLCGKINQNFLPEDKIFVFLNV